MPITRDPDFPPEIAQLIQAFGSCARGHQPRDVLEAAANFMTMAINFHVQAKGGTLRDAKLLAGEIGRGIKEQVAQNFNRKPQPTDVPVPAGQ